MKTLKFAMDQDKRSNKLTTHRVPGGGGRGHGRRGVEHAPLQVINLDPDSATRRPGRSVSRSAEESGAQIWPFHLLLLLFLLLPSSFSATAPLSHCAPGHFIFPG